MGRPKGAKSDPNRKPLQFKQTEVQRAIRGVQAQGLPVHRVDVDPRSGLISIMAGPAIQNDDAAEKAWDARLKENAQNEKQST